MNPDDQTALRKLSYTTIWQTRKSLRADLVKAFSELPQVDEVDKRFSYIHDIAKIRTLADEILRWELL